MLRLLVLLFAFALPAQAEQVVAELSQTRVSITANFDGSSIWVFGAVKRDAPAPEPDPAIPPVEDVPPAAEPEGGERILGQVLGSEELNVFIKLELVLFKDDVKLP